MKAALAAGLRSTAAKLTILAAVITSVVVAISRSMPWRGEWGWTLGAFESILVLLGPAIAASTAFASAGFRAVNRSLLLPAVRRSTAAVVAPTFAGLLIGLVSWVMIGAAMAAMTGLTGATDTLNVIPLVRSLALYAFYVSLGIVVGSMLPRVPATLLAGTATYVLIIVGTRSATLGFLAPFSSSGSVAPWQPDGLAVAIQTVMLVVLSAGLLAFLVGLLTGRQRSLTTAGAAALALVLGSGFTATGQRPLWVERTTLDYQCAGGPIRVCLVQGNTNKLDEWARDVNATANKLRSLQLSIPSTYEQFPRKQVDTGVGYLQISGLDVNIASPSYTDIIASIAGPSDCGQLNGGAWQIYRGALADWIRTRLEPSYSPSDPNLARWMREAGPADQVTWAHAAQEALHMCARMPPTPFPLSLPNS